MPDIQTGDVGRKLQNRYNLLGPPPAPFLSPEIVPVTLVDDLTQFDLLAPTFEKPYEAEFSVSAPVGQRAQIVLINPVDSGIICTTEGWIGHADILSQAAWQILDNATLALPSINNRGLPRDLRTGTFDEGACGLQGGSIAGTGTQGRGFLVMETVPRPRDLMPFPIVLPPGHGLYMTQQTQNGTINCYWRWRERPVNEGDLALIGA